MKILAFDTSMQACSVAVMDTEHPEADIVSTYHQIIDQPAENLLPMIEDIMSKAGMSFQSLDKIAVTIGPGSFTGVRIGIATARGLRLGLKSGLYGFSSLHVMALKAIYSTEPEILSQIEQIIVSVDARRDEIYVQSFDKKGNISEPPQAITPDRINIFIQNKSSLIVGSGTNCIQKALSTSQDNLCFAYPDLRPDAKFLCLLANMNQGVVAPFSPLYLRAPDAKPQTNKHIERIYSS